MLAAVSRGIALIAASACRTSRLAAPSQRAFLSTAGEGVSALVVAEHAEGALARSTLSAVSMAAELGGSVDLLLAGAGMADLTQQACAVPGVGKVLVADTERLRHQMAEPMADLLVALQQRRGFSHLVAAASTWGRDVMPRAAALLGVQQVSDVVAAVDARTFTRPIYAGNAFATVRCCAPDQPRLLTVRPTAYAPAAAEGGAGAAEPVSAEELCTAQQAPQPEFVSIHTGGGERPDLGAARVVVSGGRGLGSADGFKVLEQLADVLGAALGASRAAVDAGFVPNELQVGQTGRVVAPDLYIAVGISGAIQHVAGMKDSKTIVAINSDPEAPIFQVADYGLVQDLGTAVPELVSKLSSGR